MTGVLMAYLALTFFTLVIAFVAFLDWFQRKHHQKHRPR